MFKKLAKDSLAFFANSLVSQLVGVLLVAVYTRYMLPGEYGLIELIRDTARLLMPFATMGITDGIMRFSLDKKDPRELLSTGYSIILCGMAVVSIITIVVNLSGFYYFDSLWIILSITFLMSLDSVYGAYLKGCDKTKAFALIGITRTAVLFSSVMLFVVAFRLGANGYLISLALCYFVSIILYIITSKFEVLRIVKPPKELLVALVLYSLPLISNTTCWQIVNVADKYFINHYFGKASVGIYSVAQKIPSIVSMVTSVFISAWQITATKQHQENNLSNAFNSVQNIYCWLICFASAIPIVLCKPILSFFVGQEFQGASLFIPILTLGSFFNAMTAFSGSAYMVTKKTSSIFYSSLLAAITNVLLNALLIPRIGEIGAAIATVACYFVAWSVRIIRMRKIEDVSISNITPIICGISLTGIATLSYFEHYVTGGIIGIVLLGLSFFAIRKDLLFMAHDLFSRNTN